MPKLSIDGDIIEVEDGITLLQACELAGREIPRFCYHERLSIAGNCRMCLVEVVGMPKPIASCAMSVNDLRPGKDGTPPMINTKTPLVKKAREGVMEFLLINHPLDCPICDQGGECDLQDQAMAFGVDGSRYQENKRAVEEKNIGPLIKTVMTRCIHCTRCVRFMTEVAGVPELGAIGRGEDVEITTYLEAGVMSELSGNVIDLCPVGALTSKPYAFAARPWELRKTESVDVMDAVGSNIRVDCRGREVMRFLPRNHDAVNEEWISDKTRFVWDGLKARRLDQPLIRLNGRLEPASWDEALSLVAVKMTAVNPARAGALVGDLASVEEVFALSLLLDQLGWHNRDCRTDGAKLDPSLGRGSYLFNSSIEGIEAADALMLVGTNPRTEAAVLNARIRKRALRGGFPIALIGPRVDLTYDYHYLGAGPKSLEALQAHTVAQAQRPMMIVGPGAYTRPDGVAILALVAQIAQATGVVRDGWNGFNILHTAASRVGALDLGFVPGQGGRDATHMVQPGALDVIFALGVDEIPMPAGSFVIYQGSHGDRGAAAADVVLPGAAYTEKFATYVNMEGRPQLANRAAFPPGQAKEDWAIIRALSGHMGKPLPFDSLAELRATLYKQVPHMARLDQVVAAPVSGVAKLGERGIAGMHHDTGFTETITDFYRTNPIARASTIMAEMSALAAEATTRGTGTHG